VHAPDRGPSPPLTDLLASRLDAAAEFATFIAAEQKRWQPTIDRARVKPD
jgi:hypothetical protein